MVLEIGDRFGCLSGSGQITEHRASLIEGIASKLPTSDYKLLQLIAASGLLGSDVGSGEVIVSTQATYLPGSGEDGALVDFHNTSSILSADEASSVLLTPSVDARISFGTNDPSLTLGHFVTADTNINISGDSYKNLKIFLFGDSQSYLNYTLYK